MILLRYPITSLINLSQSTYYLIISQKNTLAQFTFLWSDHFIPYLGIQFALTPVQTIEANMKDLFIYIALEIKRLIQFPFSE